MTRHVARWSIRIALFALFAISDAAAQSPQRVQGTVMDATKAPLPGVMVQLIDAAGRPAAETQTDETGAFAFASVPPGEYTVRATLQGFQAPPAPLVVAAEAPHPVKIQMRVVLDAEVTVSGSKTGDPVSPDSNADAIEVDYDAIRALPSDSQALVPILSNFLSPAASAQGVSVVTDGIEGSTLSVPASSIKRLFLNRNPYSVQYRGPGKARVEVVTDHGSRSLVHGAAALFFRNSAFDARNALAAETPELNRAFLDTQLGGPLPGKGFSFFFAGERLNNDASEVVHAIVPEGSLISNVPAPERRTNLVAGFDWRRHRKYELNVRYSLDDETERGQGVGGISTAEQAYTTSERAHQIVLGNHMIFSDAFVNDLRFSVSHEQARDGGPAINPQVIVEGAFVSGPSQVFSSERELSMKAQEVATFVRGAHTLRVGGSFRPKSVRAMDATNFGGTYHFSNLSQFVLGTPFLFTSRSGAPFVSFTDPSASAYVEHTIRLGIGASFTGGFRDDWEPRLGHSWGPRAAFVVAPGSQKTVIRTGVGLFSGDLSESVIVQTLLADGEQIRELALNNPSYPSIRPSDLTARRPSVTRLSPDLGASQTLQTGISVDRRLWRKSAMSVEYQYLRGFNLFRSIDVNAPLPATGERPDAAFQNVYEVESTGTRTGHSASATFNGRLWHFKMSAQYTWSHVMDNTSGPMYLPADNYNLGPEWGPSNFDRRHRLSLMATRDWNEVWRLSPVLVVSSGSPFEITTGFDDNRDSRDTDRPLGVSRNAGRGPLFAQLDLRATRVLRVGGPVNREDEEKQPQTLELNVDAFNVFNHVNATEIIGVVSSPLFGHVASASKARTLQLSVKYRF